MRLTDIRIRNFRSIESEQHLPIPGRSTLVGPNNSGKTNLLRAIQVLFTGYNNEYGYARENDLTFGAGRARTSITATFDGKPDEEEEIYEALDELHELQGTERKGTSFSLNLYFTDTNTPVYGFFPNVKRPKNNAQAAQYSRTHKALVIKLLSRFSLHYVPSAKSVEQIYEELLMPFLRRKVSGVLEPHLGDIDRSLAEAATALNKELKAANLGDYKASFSLPNQSIEALVAGFDFMIEDPQKTPIQEKGMGVQTTAVLAAFRWITEQEIAEGREVLWLLEEPESYLHPNLASQCNRILESLAEEATVVKTTHSMAFVPQQPHHVRGTILNEKSRTELESYSTFNEAVSKIRSSLGIKFSDFYNLDVYNVFVEGPSDRDLFYWVLSQIPPERLPAPVVRKAKFEDFGGVVPLAGFLRATYEFIREERACVAVFDGDEAGERQRRALQQYFGQKHVPFEANKNFVSVRAGFSIEGLFPDEWIIAIHSEKPGWFDNFSVDAQGTLEPFKVKDSKKSQIQGRLMERALGENKLEWAASFEQVFKIIDEALDEQQQMIYILS